MYIQLPKYLEDVFQLNMLAPLNCEIKGHCHYDGGIQFYLSLIFASFGSAQV